jgi:hypothetical protein
MIIPLFLIQNGCSDISSNEAYSTAYSNSDGNISSQNSILKSLPIVDEKSTGTLCGNLYKDRNQNQKQETKESGIRGISISILDSEGRTYGGMTDDQGYFCIKKVPEGKTIITIGIDTLPKNMKLAHDEDRSKEYIVQKEINNNLSSIAYVQEKQTSSICGDVMVDGKGYLGAEITLIVDKEHIKKVYSNKNGEWCDKTHFVGTEITVDIVESSLPKDVMRVIGKDNDTYVIIKEGTSAMIDGYEIKKKNLTQ